MDDLVDMAVEPEGVCAGLVVQRLQQGYVVQNGRAVRGVRLIGVIGQQFGHAGMADPVGRPGLQGETGTVLGND